MPDLPSILVGLALLALVVFTIAQPLLDRRALRAEDVAERDRLVAERESVLISLRDLDFDFSTGKIVEDDYRPQRAELVARGATILKRLDDLGAQAGAAPAAAAEAEVERAIAQARRGRTSERPDEGADPARVGEHPSPRDEARATRPTGKPRRR